MNTIKFEFNGEYYMIYKINKGYLSYIRDNVLEKNFILVILDNDKILYDLLFGNGIFEVSKLIKYSFYSGMAHKMMIDSDLLKYMKIDNQYVSKIEFNFPDTRFYFYMNDFVDYMDYMSSYMNKCINDTVSLPKLKNNQFIYDGKVYSVYKLTKTKIMDEYPINTIIPKYTIIVVYDYSKLYKKERIRDVLYCDGITPLSKSLETSSSLNYIGDDAFILPVEIKQEHVSDYIFRDTLIINNFKIAVNFIPEYEYDNSVIEISTNEGTIGYDLNLLMDNSNYDNSEYDERDDKLYASTNISWNEIITASNNASTDIAIAIDSKVDELKNKIKELEAKIEETNSKEIRVNENGEIIW